MSKLKAQLNELVRPAEAQEDIALTQLGKQVVQPAPTKPGRPTAGEKLALFESIMESGRAKIGSWEEAAQNQDCLKSRSSTTFSSLGKTAYP